MCEEPDEPLVSEKEPVSVWESGALTTDGPMLAVAEGNKAMPKYAWPLGESMTVVDKTTSVAG